jgi:hypothetical protein
MAKLAERRDKTPALTAADAVARAVHRNDGKRKVWIGLKGEYPADSATFGGLEFQKVSEIVTGNDRRPCVGKVLEVTPEQLEEALVAAEHTLLRGIPSPTNPRRWDEFSTRSDSLVGRRGVLPTDRPVFVRARLDGVTDPDERKRIADEAEERSLIFVREPVEQSHTPRTQEEMLERIRADLEAKQKALQAKLSIGPDAPPPPYAGGPSLPADPKAGGSSTKVQDGLATDLKIPTEPTPEVRRAMGKARDKGLRVTPLGEVAPPQE